MSVLNILAISGTNGSSGLGSHKREQIDNSTAKKRGGINFINKEKKALESTGEPSRPKAQKLGHRPIKHALSLT